MQKLILTFVALSTLLTLSYYMNGNQVQTVQDSDVPTWAFDLFHHWKINYNKSYGGSGEEKHRLNIFFQNVLSIKEHQSNPERTYEKKVNQFADLTADEFKAMYRNFNPAQKEANVVTELTHEAASSVDWRKNGAVTPVKDQGQCGSCWAFSTVGALEGASALFGAKKLGNFAEQQLVDCSKSYGNHGCNGGLMDYGFKYVKEHGIVNEDQYKYTARTGRCKKNKGPFTISGWTDVAQGNVDQLAKAVTQQPISIAVDATNFQFYESGVFSDCKQSLDHGVTLVGYTPEAWIVKNSWGEAWGQQGYITLKRGNTCGLANAASYPQL